MLEMVPPEIQGQVCPPRTLVEKIHTETALQQVTTASTVQVDTSETLCVNTHTCNSVVACRRGSLKISLACQIITWLMKNLLG